MCALYIGGDHEGAGGAWAGGGGLAKEGKNVSLKYFFYYLFIFIYLFNFANLFLFLNLRIYLNLSKIFFCLFI